ncbi:MAG: hypothetical protein Q9170_005433 [Blastenia crenularia]
MTLDDFEKSLLEEQRTRDADECANSHAGSRKRRKKDHHHHHRHRHYRRQDQGDENGHSHRLLEHSEHHLRDELKADSSRGFVDTHGEEGEYDWVEKDAPATDWSAANTKDEAGERNELKRDAWMQDPSAIDVDYIHRDVKDLSKPATSASSKADFELKIHDNELDKHHLQDIAEGKDVSDEVINGSSQHSVDYAFGDSGSQWRMTKLRAVYRRANESGADIDDVAREQYGDLRAFDDAREEETELSRRETYGEGYVGKDRPSGELFEERKLQMGVCNDRKNTEAAKIDEQEHPQPRLMSSESAPQTTKQVDQSTLNRLKAQMIKAKLKNSAEASKLEAEYNEALGFSRDVTKPGTVVLGAMDNRMLAGGQRGEVKSIDTKRGRERGLVEENEDMSIEDMVREERRTRNQAGGDGQRFAERIAKDAKFDTDLEYMDENAAKLAKRVQRSGVNLKNTAISDFQKMNRILDSCALCHHEGSSTPPVAPLVSLATRVYLTLPTEPEISDGGACIIPIQHRGNLLECDDDEWEEIRNFMKSLTRMYHDQGRDVLFYENAAAPQRRKHAGMDAVPLPYSLGETAPAFFREAILTSDEEWTQHKKLIDTLAKAKQGLGKLAFRKTLAKEMPYFHVWFEIDGGLGHIVEDANRWPKGDLFAREIIGGMLDKAPDVIKRQGRWQRGNDHRVESFRKRWKKFDWTRILTNM